MISLRGRGNDSSCSRSSQRSGFFCQAMSFVERDDDTWLAGLIRKRMVDGSIKGDG